MAAEQLGPKTYLVGQPLTLSGFEVVDSSYGFEEDGETRYGANGTFGADLTYSRRQTLSVTLDVLAGEGGGNPATYVNGGSIASGVFPLADGSTETAWKIRSATPGRTKGVATLQLELVQLGDAIT